MTTKSEKLERKLAALREQIAAAKEAEQKADKDELLRLIDRANCLPEALEWVSARVGRRKQNKQTEQEEQQ